MSKIIPNENSWIAFTTATLADYTSPTADELAAAINLTPLVVSINATSQGNAIPTPALDSLFDRSIIGTSQGQFQADMYRDDPDDLAWVTLPRAEKGHFFISRFGGSGLKHMPVAGEEIEVWPVQITSRAGSNMTSNTVQTFTLTAAVPEVPKEDGVVALGTGVPSTPRNLVATAGATGIVELDWDVPLSTGSSAITGYKVFKSTVAGGAGSYTEVTTSITKLGTTANLTGLASGLTYFKVAATNTGDSVQSAFASATVV